MMVELKPRELREHRNVKTTAILIQAEISEGAETISKESTSKRMEARGPVKAGDDIVRSAWKHVAGNAPGQFVAKTGEHKRTRNSIARRPHSMNLWSINPVNSVNTLTSETRAIPSEAPEGERVETIRKEYDQVIGSAGTRQKLLDKFFVYDIVRTIRKLLAGAEWTNKSDSKRMRENGKDTTITVNENSNIKKNIRERMIGLNIIGSIGKKTWNGSMNLIANHTGKISNGMMTEEKKCFESIRKSTGHDLLLDFMLKKGSSKDQTIVPDVMKNVNRALITMIIFVHSMSGGFVENATWLCTGK